MVFLGFACDVGGLFSDATVSHFSWRPPYLFRLRSIFHPSCPPRMKVTSSEPLRRSTVRFLTLLCLWRMTCVQLIAAVAEEISPKRHQRRGSAKRHRWWDDKHYVPRCVWLTLTLSCRIAIGWSFLLRSLTDSGAVESTRWSLARTPSTYTRRQPI